MNIIFYILDEKIFTIYYLGQRYNYYPKTMLLSSIHNGDNIE